MPYIDRGKNVPLYEQIYRAIKEDILSGRLPGGARLVATRRLALELSVGRNTVENAYQQLAVEGYVTPRTGSGYTVNDLALPHAAGDARSIVPAAGTARGGEAPPPEFDFRAGRVETRLFPADRMRRRILEQIRRMPDADAPDYPPQQGDARLREAVAAHLYAIRGVICRAENIVITYGHQYSLDVICTLLTGAGPVVAMENPGYAGARELFLRRGAGLVPVPVERDGVSIAAVRASNANLLYTTPSHQFPTGAVLSIKKRLEAVDWAAERGYIIENDYDSELCYNSRQIPALYAMDAGGRVIYLGTLSRPLSMELCVAYMVLPDALMRVYREQYALQYGSVPPFIQRAVADYIESGDCARHMDRFRVASRKKRDLLLAEITRAFGDRVRVAAAGGGLHVLLSVSAPWTPGELLARAEARGVRLYPVADCYPPPAPPSEKRLILGYGGVTAERFPEALKRLKSAWFPEEN